MTDYSMSELGQWNEKIEKIAQEVGLDYYDQEFEICSFEDMIGCETYVGMPSHYPHWSYGKHYEKTKTLHKYNLTGLPYEMVINSDPCIAYLMKDNTLLLQILTIAHVYGHNDFFKNNRLFKMGTNAKETVSMFKNHANRIRGYINDPGIGYERVEKILNAAHAIKFQISRVIGEKKLSQSEKVHQPYEKYNTKPNDYPLLYPKVEKDSYFPDLNKIPVEPDEDLLQFFIRYSKLNDWERDILNIVREESLYFLPQIETKIMNEGRASFWHYTILNKPQLEQGLHFEFLKRHNQVIRPHMGGINPYYVGFKIFEDLVSKHGLDAKKIFEVREVERDQSFLRKYLTKELCEEMHLSEYTKIGSHYVVSNVSDEDGWKDVRDAVASNAGVSGIPVIKVLEWVQKDNMLILEHHFEGRELDLGYAYETLKHIIDIWIGKVMLVTFVNGTRKIIHCDEFKKIKITDS